MLIKNLDTSETIEYMCDSEEEKVGKGSTCKCYTAKCTRNERIYLIKEFLDYSEAANDAIILNERITSIKEMYRKKGLNYCLDDYFIGCSVGETTTIYYQVFQYYEGETLTTYHSVDYDEDGFKLIIKHYLDFLHGLKVFHDNQMVHMDIKPSNIFSFTGNEQNTRWLQLIDFGSLNSVGDVKNNFEDGEYRIRSSSRPWYLEEDEDKLIDIVDDIFFNSDNIIKVMDCTASARILAFMLCGQDTENGKLPPSEEELNHFLDQLPKEGVRLALQRFFDKAFAPELGNRFLDCQEMISYIEDILNSFSSPKTSRSLKIKLLSAENENDSFIYSLKQRYIKMHDDAEHKSYSDISVNDLIEDIHTGILPHLESSEDRYSLCDCRTALSQVLDQYPDKNILLIGEGGAGKTTSLLFQWLNNLKNLDDNTLYLYAPLNALGWEGESLTKFIDNKLPGARQLCESKERSEEIIFLLDAYDEIDFSTHSHSSPDERSLLKQLKEFSGQYSNVRFVMTSRFVPHVSQKERSEKVQKEEDKEIINFVRSLEQIETCPLSEEQICDYLNVRPEFFDGTDKLLELVKNTFLLILVKKTYLLDVKNRWTVNSSTEIIYDFLWKTVRSKVIVPRPSKEDFDYTLKEIAKASYCSFGYWYNSDLFSNIPNKGICKALNNIIECKPVESESEETWFNISYLNKAIYDFIQGLGLAQNLEKLSADNTELTLSKIEKIFLERHFAKSDEELLHCGNFLDLNKKSKCHLCNIKEETIDKMLFLLSKKEKKKKWTDFFKALFSPLLDLGKDSFWWIIPALLSIICPLIFKFFIMPSSWFTPSPLTPLTELIIPVVPLLPVAIVIAWVIITITFEPCFREPLPEVSSLYRLLNLHLDCQSFYSIDFHGLFKRFYFPITTKNNLKIPKETTKFKIPTVELDWDGDLAVDSNGIEPYSISVDPNSKHFETRDGMLFDKKKKQLLYCFDRSTDTIVVPDGVKKIGKFAFFSLPSLERIILPKSIKKLESNAIFICPKLWLIAVPNKKRLKITKKTIEDNTEALCQDTEWATLRALAELDKFIAKSKEFLATAQQALEEIHTSHQAAEDAIMSDNDD